MLGGSGADPALADTAAGFSYSWNVTKDGAAYDSGTGDTFRFTERENATYTAFRRNTNSPVQVFHFRHPGSQVSHTIRIRSS